MLVISLEMAHHFYAFLRLLLKLVRNGQRMSYKKLLDVYNHIIIFQ